MKLLKKVSIIFCFVAVLTFSGCVLPFYSCGLLSSIGDLGFVGEGYFTDLLDNYALCEFADDEVGIGFKVYNGNNSSSYYWGHVTKNGEQLVACFDMYGSGETHIYLSEDENTEVFNFEAAVLNLKFSNGEIVCKKVISDNLDLNLSNLKLQYRELDKSEFLPHENAFVKNFSDENHVLQVSRYNWQAFYSGRARTIEGGVIKTHVITLVFLPDGVFEIYDSDTQELLSEGTYRLIDYNTATLKFGQKDNLYSNKPFESYPYLTVSGEFYAYTY